MDHVAKECRIRKHHPEWANVYNEVFVRWTTHRPRGLSERDLEMARFCEIKAAECAVEQEDENVEVKGQEKVESGLEALADGLAERAGDCCVPKKRKQ